MVAVRYLCFATCLQLVAKDDCDVEIDPIALANHLGVIVPEGYDLSDLTKHGITAVRTSVNPEDFGIIPNMSAVNAFLAPYLLQCSYESIANFQDWIFEDTLEMLYRSGVHPIVGFESRALFGGGSPQGQGHCAVVNEVQCSNRAAVAVMFDPGPDSGGLHQVRVESLYMACRKKRGGIWVLKAA